MLRYAWYPIIAALILSAGCLRFDDSDEGLVLRHLPMSYWAGADSYADSYYPEGITIHRDSQCWQEAIGDPQAWYATDSSPSPQEQALEVDFNSEMVIFLCRYLECGAEGSITHVRSENEHLVVEVSRTRGAPTLPCVSLGVDAVVVPKSDQEVEVQVSCPIGVCSIWAFLLDNERFDAIPVDGPCTQTAP